MRNLKLEDVKVHFLQNASVPLQLCFGFDTCAENSVVYTVGDNLKITKNDPAGGSSWTTGPEYPFKAPESVRVVNLTFLSWSNDIVVGFCNGDIWKVKRSDGSWEHEGICPGGLEAMEWSPDQELVVLVSTDSKMILMSPMFDPLAECSLRDNTFGESDFVTVGWGKKETQFHGSEGKQAATAKADIIAENSEVPKIQNTIITWRGDGQLFAVGTVIDGIRRFKVFDKEGQLQYTSEKQAGLEANMAWKPSGNVIATTQKLPNKYVVAFFEKNGLKHGEFVIPVNSNTIVKEISWSSDSEILSLLCYDQAQNIKSILLFTSNNYHWYLKQALTYTADQNIVKVIWDTWDLGVNCSKRLHVFLAEGQHLTYHWKWNVDHSAGIDHRDDAVVGVIDGTKVLLTNFRHTVVPPPMSTLQLETTSNIEFIFFGPIQSTMPNTPWNSNSLCVVTENGEFIFYKQSSSVPLKYEVVGTFNSMQNAYPLKIYNFLWLKEDVVTSIEVEQSDYYIKEYFLNSEGDKLTLELKQSLKLDMPRAGVWATQPHPNNKTKMFLLSQHDIYEYTVGGNVIKIKGTVEPKDSSFRTISIKDDLYFLTLERPSSLRVHHFANEQLVKHSLMENVSSFFVQSDFLLLTTLKHELICIELLPSAFEESSNKVKGAIHSHHYKRSIERGSKLVVAVPNATRTVLQLPRGNLEVIQPRPLSLKLIGEFLDNYEYFKAFDLMRKERINLNLICDHNPDKFLENVDTFINKIKNPSWLSLFLSDLENVDVTTTMYASSYNNRTSKPNQNVNLKVSSICEIVRFYLDQRSDREQNILPILTSYVKKNTTKDLEKSLQVVKELKTLENMGQKPSVSSEEALKYLLYLVDVNYLYDVALGMYDFDLVLLVASKSQKDPKEYVPMLNELNELDENMKRFTINKELKRYDRAVECLVKCGSSHHQELRTFVKYHSLFQVALALLQPSENIYRNISEDFGLHLKLKKHFTEAGFVYRRGGNVKKAVECFTDALEWELAIQLARFWPEDEFRDLCDDLVAALKEEKRHGEALTILEQYCDNQEKTISYAVECGLYKTALRIYHRHQNMELRNSQILTAVQEDLSNLTDTINTNAEMFKKHKLRLTVVRTNKKTESEETFDTSYLHKDSDLYSDAGSTVASSASRGSSRSFRSSKNRRKHERKLVSLKEGSQYEEVALVTALHTLTTASFELRNRAGEINLALRWFEMDTEANTLQSILESLLKDMRDSFRDIWTNEFALEAANASVAAQLDTEGTPQGIAALGKVFYVYR